MTEAASVARLDGETERWWKAGAQRFGLWGAAIGFLLFVANFAVLDLEGGDSPVQYAWVQNLYGDTAESWAHGVPPGHPIGYYFGLGLVEAPFYGLGKILAHLGVQSIGGHPVKPALVALGTGPLLVAGASALMVRTLRRIGVEQFAGLALLAAIFGTSLVFWIVFSPGKDHPADAALFTAVVALTLQYFRGAGGSRTLLLLIGLILGFSITVRYFAGAEAVALVAVLLSLRRWRHALELALATTAAFVLLLCIPIGLGTPVFGGGYSVSQQAGFYPLNPFRMLFTDYRGLFVWSPVTILAAIGLVVLYRRHPADRNFLVAVYSMGLAIVFSYAFVPYWDGAWSFGQRFYTPLFPLVALGLAALIKYTGNIRRAAVVAAIVAATAWSLFLCLNLIVARPLIPSWKVTVPIGATGVAELPAQEHISTGAYLWGVYYRSRLIKPLVPWPFAHH